MLNYIIKIYTQPEGLDVGITLRLDFAINPYALKLKQSTSSLNVIIGYLLQIHHAK